MSKTTVNKGGMSFSSALLLAFIVLKLCGTIDWSWWWVAAPVWGPLALVCAGALVFGAISGAVAAATVVIGVAVRVYDMVKENRR